MTKMTLTKMMRRKEDGTYYPPQKRESVACKCGRSKLLSVGQIWICKHKDA